MLYDENYLGQMRRHGHMSEPHSMRHSAHHSIVSDPDRLHTEHAGMHESGQARQAEEERRKASFFHAFHADSNGSVTKLHENFSHHDRNR